MTRLVKKIINKKSLSPIYGVGHPMSNDKGEVVGVGCFGKEIIDEWEDEDGHPQISYSYESIPTYFTKSEVSVLKRAGFKVAVADTATRKAFSKPFYI